MRNLLKLLVWGVLLIIAYSVQGANAQEDTILARMAAAEKYVEVIGFDRLITDAAFQNVKTPQAVEFMSGFLNKNVPSMKSDITDLMARIYTAGELNALVAFYSTDTGQEISKKMAASMKETALVVQKYQIKVIEEACSFTCSCIQKHLVEYIC